MKVYGWSDAGLMRGDMEAANVDKVDVEYEAAACSLGWDALFSNFTSARTEMVKQMGEFLVDPETIRLVKSLKASDVPLAEE